MATADQETYNRIIEGNKELILNAMKSVHLSPQEKWLKVRDLAEANARMAIPVEVPSGL